MGSSSSLYLLQPVEYLKPLVFSLFGLHSYHSYCSPLNHLDFSHTYFLWCTEPQTAKDSLVEILTIHTTTEELVWKGFSAILAKFNFADSGKCWAGTASALERTRDRDNVEEKKKNLGYRCHCLCCHQGDERSGAALSYNSSVGVLFVFFFYLLILCQCSTVNSHSVYDLLYPQIFFLKKISTASCSQSSIYIVVDFYIDVELCAISDWITSCFFKPHLQLLRILILIISPSIPVIPPNHMLLENLISMFSSSLSTLLMRILSNSELRNKWSFL